MTTDAGSEHDSSTDSEREIEVGSSGDTDVLEIRERLESLPQELCNHIYDFTFAADSRIRIYGRSRWDRFYLTSLTLPTMRARRIVTFDERPPGLLYVDRASREKFADSYFGGEGSTLIFCPGDGFWSSEAAHPDRALRDSVIAELQHHLWLGKSSESFKCIDYGETEALVKKRAGIADEEHEE